MNNNLKQEREDFVIDSSSPNNKWITVFEDNGKTGYMYLCSSDKMGNSIKLLTIYGFIIK